MCTITRRHLAVSKYYHSLVKGGKTSNSEHTHEPIVKWNCLPGIALLYKRKVPNCQASVGLIKKKRTKNEIKYSRNLDRCTIKYRRIHMFYYNRIFPVVPFFLHTHTSYSIKINADGTDLNFLTGGKNSLPDNISAIFTH